MTSRTGCGAAFGRRNRRTLKRLQTMLLVFAIPGMPAAAQITERISVSSLGDPGDGHSTAPVISKNGRFVAFTSEASNLVPQVANGFGQVYLHDRQTQQTTRVSVSFPDAPAYALCTAGAVSDDGRFVVFMTAADNLVPHDLNGQTDVFLRDMLAGTTTCLSVADDGRPANAWSDQADMTRDGRLVAFYSNATDVDPDERRGVFLYDRLTGETEWIAAGQRPSLSEDGRYVAFDSSVNNLVPGDTNGVRDVFVLDRAAGTTSRVSISSEGMQGGSESNTPAISADGRFVAFESYSGGLVPNGCWYGQVFVHDRFTAETRMVSAQYDGGCSFYSSSHAGISDSGELVTFDSIVPTIVQDDDNNAMDVFAHNQVSRRTVRVSVSSDLDQASAGGRTASCSGDGRLIAFASYSSDLVPADTNGVADIFVHEIGMVGDFDGDNDVDTADFAIFARCFGGSGLPPAPACPPGVDADFDGDGDVDLADFALLAHGYTGSR